MVWRWAQCAGMIALGGLLSVSAYAQRSPGRTRAGETQPPPGFTPVAPAAATPTAPAANTPAAPQGFTAGQPNGTTSLLQEPAKDAQIVFSDGQLTIHADNSSLTRILREIGDKSGMKITGLNSDERVFGKFGPGVPRDVLADLLNGTSYNQLLLGDLANGAPRELILSPASHAGEGAAPAAAAAAANNPAQNNGGDDSAAEQQQETADQPPPPPPNNQEPAQSGPPNPGVRTPQQLFEQLQQMRQAQQQQQQQQANPNQSSPQQ